MTRCIAQDAAGRQCCLYTQGDHRHIIILTDQDKDRRRTTSFIYFQRVHVERQLGLEEALR